jgi:hypothetical protein
MSGFFSIDNWADVARTITLTEQAGSIGTAHLMRALASGRIALLPLLPKESSSKFKAWARMTKHRPAVILVGDDDGFDRGPVGWAQGRRAVAWSRRVLLHGAGAELFHYELAIVAAELTHRTLVIECCSATIDGWIELVKAAPHQPSTLIITPGDGVHPLPVRKEGLH